MMSKDDVRMPVLKRLAEQAMSDYDFRKAAAADLDAALADYHYELTPKELELVHMFRSTLAENNIDVHLVKNMDLDSIFDDASVDDIQGMMGDNN